MNSTEFNIRTRRSYKRMLNIAKAFEISSEEGVQAIYNSFFSNSVKLTDETKQKALESSELVVKDLNKRLNIHERKEIREILKSRGWKFRSFEHFDTFFQYEMHYLNSFSCSYGRVDIYISPVHANQLIRAFKFNSSYYLITT